MESSDIERIKDLLQSGYFEAGQHALEDILRANPKDLQAWAYYVRTWKEPAKRIKVLELCLKYNPGNPDAQRALDNLKSKLNVPAQPPAPKPVPAPPAAYEAQPDWMKNLNNEDFSVRDVSAVSASPTVPPAQNDPTPAWLAGSAALGASDAPVSSKPPRPSNEEIDRQAREIEEGNRRERLGLGKPMAWYDVWLTALTRPNVDAYDSLLANPYALPSRTYLWLLIAGFVSGLMGMIAYGLNPQFSSALALMDQTYPGAAQTFRAFLFCLIPVAGVMNLVNTAIRVGIQHLVAGVMGGNGKFSDFLYLVAAYSAPLTIGTSIVSVIPFVGACLALPMGLYGIYLNVLAIQSAHKFDSLRAIGVIVGIFLVSLIFACLIGYVVYSSMASYLPIQPTY